MKTDKTRQEIKKIISHSKDNEVEILSSKMAGCFFCRHVFKAKDVHDWVMEDNKISAICPECGMDTVIGDASKIEITKENMKAINKTVFTSSTMKNNPDAMITYIQRYKDNKITHNDHSYSLYKKYVKCMASLGEPDALFDLSTIYENEKRYEEALKLLKDPKLSDNPRAYLKAGIIHKTKFRKNRLEHVVESYRCIAQGMALGEIEHSYLFADFYIHGWCVEENHQFALSLLQRGFGFSLESFLRYRNCTVGLAQNSFRLAEMFADPYYGLTPNTILPIRYYLICQFAEVYAIASSGVENEKPSELFISAENKLHEYLKKFPSFKKCEPVFDKNTFFDTSIDDSIVFNRKTISNIQFEKSSDGLTTTYYLTMDYENEPIVVDILNLYCGMDGKRLTWSFDDVVFCSLKEGDSFDEVIPEEDSLSFFINDSHNESVLVGTIKFLTNKQDEA